MWVPNSESEIRSVIENGLLFETRIFDAKREIPSKKGELAKDVAAMANDGGVILIGVGEDEQHRLTELCPIPLAGQRERIDSIIRSSLTEAVEITIKEITCSSDASLGFIVIIVPQSARAPHQVVVGGDNRFYGRSDTGNIILSEGEIARLYQRREKWEIDQDKLLSEVIGSYPFEKNDQLGYLHLFARPVSRTEDLLTRSSEAINTRQVLLEPIRNQAYSSQVFERNSYPGFDVLYEWKITTNGFITAHTEKESRQLILEVTNECDGFLFSDTMIKQDHSRIFAIHRIAEYSTRFCAFFYYLYKAVNYWGTVDIGVGLTGIKNCCVERQLLGRWDDSVIFYPKDEYRKTARISVEDLSDFRKIAEKLVLPLTDTLTNRRYNPFKQ